MSAFFERLERSSMRGFGAFVAALWVGLVFACLVGVVFILRSCSSGSTTVPSPPSEGGADVPLTRQDRARLEAAEVAVIRSLAEGWNPIPHKQQFMQLEFPRARESESRPTQLNMALMTRPSIAMECPGFEGSVRYSRPKLWLISGQKKVQIMRSIRVPTDELQGMTHVSYSTTTWSTLPRPLDVQITVSDLGEGRSQAARIARFAYSKGGPLRWGVIPSRTDYQRRLYIRFANSDGSTVSKELMETHEFLVGFETTKTRQRTAKRTLTPEKEWTFELPTEEATLELVLPQLEKELRVEVILQIRLN